MLVQDSENRLCSVEVFQIFFKTEKELVAQGNEVGDIVVCIWRRQSI